jgi:metal-responsive CopG/Arc/MetJ family transcriptional regulator
VSIKIVISVPGPISKRADRLARRLKKSRSQLYSDAISEYVERHDPDEITATLDAVYGSIESRPDDFVREAGRQALQSNDWRLESLAARGMVTLPTGRPRKRIRRVTVKGPSVSRAVLEDRR